MSQNRLKRAEHAAAILWIVANKDRIEKTPFDQLGILIAALEAHIDRAGISRSTFRRLCKDAGVTPPSQYFRRLKAEESNGKIPEGIEPKLDYLIKRVASLESMVKEKLFIG